MREFADSLVTTGQVRISTFWHFQADEKPEIGDPDEGQAGVLFRNNTGDPWHITASQLDSAAMSPEGHSRFTVSKTLPPGDESWIEAAGGFNTYMYSLTTADMPSKSLMSRLGYNAAVEICDLDQFCYHTGAALRQLGISRFDSIAKGASRLRTSHGPVEYVDSKRRVITPSTANELNRSEDVDARELFSKLTKFQFQQEYRIAYYFMNPITEKTLSLDVRMHPAAEPVLIHDDGIPRISETVRLIEDSEFDD